MSFPRRPAALVTFLSGKVTKAIRAGRDDLADVVSARLPLLLVSRAPARTRTSLCSNNRALLARSASSLRHRDSAGELTSTRPSVACDTLAEAWGWCE